MQQITKIFENDAGENVLTTEQAAAYLKLSPSTLVLWRQNGEPALPFVRCGRSIRYLRSDLEAFLDQHRCQVNEGEQ